MTDGISAGVREARTSKNIVKIPVEERSLAVFVEDGLIDNLEVALTHKNSYYRRVAKFYQNVAIRTLPMYPDRTRMECFRALKDKLTGQIIQKELYFYCSISEQLRGLPFAMIHERFVNHYTVYELNTILSTFDQVFDYDNPELQF